MCGGLQNFVRPSVLCVFACEPSYWSNTMAAVCVCVCLSRIYYTLPRSLSLTPLFDSLVTFHPFRQTSGPGAFSSVVLSNGAGTRPCPQASAPEAISDPSLPRRLQHVANLPHGEVVCAVTIAPAPAGHNTTGDATAPPESAPTKPEGPGDGESGQNPTEGSPVTNTAITQQQQQAGRTPHFAYTGGRGCVKLWDLDAITAASGKDVVALASFDCLRPESYVRSIKLFPVSARDIPLTVKHSLFFK